MFKGPHRAGRLLLVATALLSVCVGVAGSTIKDGYPVHCEQFGGTTNLPILILLHGVSGPTDFYRSQARFFAKNGFRVLLPHYLEAGHGTAATDDNYDAWVRAVRAVLTEVDRPREGRPLATFIVGYSLGASVALALGSQTPKLDAIAEFYGSLPDKYFRDLRGMPPLLILHGELDKEIPVSNARQLSQLCADAALKCDIHIYPMDGHGFSPESMKDADQRILLFFSQNDANKSAQTE